MWVEVRDRDGHLLFRYDPVRELIETKARGQVTVTDLLCLKGVYAEQIQQSWEQNMNASEHLS